MHVKAEGQGWVSSSIVCSVIGPCMYTNCVDTHVKAEGQSWVSSSIAAHLTFCDRVFHWVWTRLAGRQGPGNFLSASLVGMPNFLNRVPSLDPHSYTANTLPTRPSPQPPCVMVLNTAGTFRDFWFAGGFPEGGDSAWLQQQTLCSSSFERHWRHLSSRATQGLA